MIREVIRQMVQENDGDHGEVVKQFFGSWALNASPEQLEAVSNELTEMGAPEAATPIGDSVVDQVDEIIPDADDDTRFRALMERMDPRENPELVQTALNEAFGTFFRPIFRIIAEEVVAYRQRRD
jgi:hypothetical protein